MSESHNLVDLSGMTAADLKKNLVNIVSVVKMANTFLKNDQLAKILDIADVAVNNDNLVNLLTDVTNFFLQHPSTKDKVKDLVKNFS